jgi:Predicted enzyme of the cupin superfamily
MADIKVEKLEKVIIETKGIAKWPIWTKEVSKFDWHYDSTEECFILEGSVKIETKDGKTVKFGKGDFVTFPKGLSCTWIITEPVRKHYNFK